MLTTQIESVYSLRLLFLMWTAFVSLFLWHIHRVASMLFTLVPLWPGKDSHWLIFYWADKAERCFMVPQRVASASTDTILSGGKSKLHVFIARSFSVFKFLLSGGFALHDWDFAFRKGDGVFFVQSISLSVWCQFDVTKGKQILMQCKKEVNFPSLILSSVHKNLWILNRE